MIRSARVQRGIYLAMGKLHVLCFRTLLKRVHECQLEAGGHATQLRLDAVTACCTSLGMDVDEVEVRSLHSHGCRACAAQSAGSA